MEFHQAAPNRRMFDIHFHSDTLTSAQVKVDNDVSFDIHLLFVLGQNMMFAVVRHLQDTSEQGTFVAKAFLQMGLANRDLGFEAIPGQRCRPQL